MLQKWILPLFILTLLSKGIEAQVWDSQINKLLFGAGLQQSCEEMIQTLAANGALKMDTFSRKAFEENGELCIDKKFHFIKHPLFQFSFEDGIIRLDTFRGNGKPASFQQDYWRVLMHIVFANKEERDRGFTSLVNLFRPLSQNMDQKIDSPANKCLTYPASYSITLENGAGSSVRYLSVLAGPAVVQIRDLKPKSRNYAVTIAFYYEKPFWLALDKRIKGSK